jgi:Tol biopolymer transport system component
MGEVWRARDHRLDRDVALKVLPASFGADPERLARFEREAKVLASLSHPNIGAIFGLEEADGVPALVLELVEGPTLADRIARGPIPIDEALPIAIQIAAALEAAHEHGIIHRDLKPANIKIRADGTVKVLDFGLAKAFGPPLAAAAAAGDRSNSPTMKLGAATEVGVILGTASYMAPEQARGRAVDKRADVWAFGCVLYEMLAGARAFAGEDVSAILAEVMKAEPEWSRLPASASGAIGQLLRRCLTKDPLERLRDIGEARILLRNPIAGAPDTAAGEAATRSGLAATRWGRLAAVACLTVAIAGVAGFLVGRTSSPRETRVRRYSIPLPADGLTLAQAISPDGKWVATWTPAADPKGQIFVRALDSWGMRALPGTEPASNPFWSPDSRHIAFFADQKLKRVAVSGGPAETVCEVREIFDARGSWGGGGAIVFAPSNLWEPGPLRSVPATGGASRPVTEVEAGETHRFPLFLPDGRHFLYTSVGGSRPGIYVASLDDGIGRRLLADVSSAHVPPAPRAGEATHLLFVRDRRIMAQRFDQERLELEGEPFVLLDEVPYDDDGGAGVSLSAEGTLLYRAGGQRERDSRSAWFDRSGAFQSNEGAPGPIVPLSLSPDGASMAVLGREPGDNRTGDFWLRDLTRGLQQRFTYQDAIDINSNAVWSPDGRRILMSANLDGSVDLFWQDTSSSGPPEPLLETDHSKYVSDWSRDGRYVLYTDFDPETQADLWYLRLEPASMKPEAAGAPEAFLRTEFNETAGQVSPDGNWIAYTSDEAGPAQWEVYVRPFPNGPGKWQVSAGQAQQPRWRADGRELFFFAGRPAHLRLMSVAVTRAAPGSAQAAPVFEAAPPIRLFDVRLNSYYPSTGTFFYSPSADGRRFLINHMDFSEDPALNVVVDWQRAFGVSDSAAGRISR